MKNKTPLIVLGILGLFIVMFFSWAIGVNNKLVALDEAVNAQSSQVDNVYQRRLDLIPNLVNTVKGYAKHEAEVLEEVTKARSQVGNVKLSGAQDIQAFEKAQSGLSSALSRLMVVVEKYPDLKADKNFRDLQSQLEGTENRITVERQRFNETSKDFNIYVRTFPQSIIAGFRNFHEKKYFSADAAAKTAPKVEF